MKLRIITAVVALAIFAPILFFSYTWPFVAFACLMGLISSYELLQCCGLFRVWFISLPTMLVFTVIPFCTRYVFAERSSFLKYTAVVLIFYLFYLFTCAVFSHGKAKISDCCTAFAMCVYSCAGFCSMVFLRDLADGGAFMFPLIFIGAWVTDTGAYFSGVLFGKHKLIPDVSPKKTVEGAIGGVALTTLVFAGYGLLISSVYQYSVNYAAITILGIIIAIISMIGDLIASLVKRNYEIKDYGNLFPGHGGVLDRFDSIIATALILFVFTNISEFFILFK